LVEFFREEPGGAGSVFYLQNIETALPLRRGALPEGGMGVARNWRGGRAVECGGLENRWRRKPLVGSNPTLSVAY
jgi:hypothetical protein